jgi:tape measure domain-containing protein
MGIAAQRAGGKVNKYEKETKQATRATDKMSRSSKKLTRMFGLLSAGIGGLTFVGLARSIESATTQMNNIEATMRVAAGSSQAAAEQIAFIREESERLGLFFPTVAKQMAQFSAAARGTSITSEELKMIFTGISEASRAMGLTAPEAEGAMKALQQMMSKGKVSAEELRQQLGERMPGSIQIMAASLDVTTQELFKMMENGELLSDEVLPKFARELIKTFSGEASLQAEKIAASIQRLQTAFFNLMAQGDLSGAANAIDRLAITISNPEFQQAFDSFIQGLAELSDIITKNIDKIANLIAILTAGAVVRTLIKMGAALGAAGSGVAALTGLLALLIIDLVDAENKVLDLEGALRDLGGAGDFVADVLSTYDDIINSALGPIVDLTNFLMGAEKAADSAADSAKSFSKEIQKISGPEKLTNVILINDMQFAGTLDSFSGIDLTVKEINENLSVFDDMMLSIGGSVREVSDTMETGIGNALEDLIVRGEEAKDVFKQLAAEISTAILRQQVIDPAASAITSAIGGFFPGGGQTGGQAATTAQMSNMSFIPQNANGGNVFGGSPSIVGERGPELFVPGQDGRIIPNHQMGGGGDVTVNIINQGGEQLEAQQQQTRRGPNGEQTVDVMVKSSMERLDSQGQLDGIFRRHGAQRQGQF